MTFRSSLACAALLLTLSPAATESGTPGASKKGQLPKPNTEDTYRPFLINTVFNYYGNNGDGSYNKFSTSNEGFEFPKGSNKTLIFEDGVIWGGYHKGRSFAKVGGSMYRHGLSAGPIIVNGTATTDPTGDDATAPANRIYRVRPDISPRVSQDVAMSLIESSEVPYITRYEKYTPDQIYQQYITDWNEWPAAEGAPFTYGVDASGNQRKAPLPYDPSYDTPGVPGAAQTLWYVANDCNAIRTAYLAGSPVIGFEMHRTIWGYSSLGGFDRTIFMSTLLINKSGATVDTMYLGQWSDPDIGDAGDDFAGCDTSRDLGYAYNGEAVDALYGTAVPAAGFVLLQGPMVPSPGDTAVFKLSRRAGFKNLKMSAFECYFPISIDPVQAAGSDIILYRELEGLLGQSGAPILDPYTQQPTKFEVPGDPVTGTGWIDGQFGQTPQDRRFLMSTGPFTMAPGDTQEIVTALIGGLGADRLSSITVLRAETDKVRDGFRNLFAFPSPPPAPRVLAAPLDREIILTWGDSATLAATESTVSQGYVFEGYDIYEYSDAAGDNPVRLATFDAVDGIKAIVDTVYDLSTGFYLTSVVQRGTDNGIAHSMTITSSRETGLPLSNGSSYYLGVTAYSYNPSPPAISGTHSLESAPQIITVIPHAPNPGARLNQSQGDTLQVTLTQAPGSPRTDGAVTANVVDPTRVTGDTYAVTFKRDTVRRVLTWSISDQTKNVTLLSNATNQSGNNAYPIVDGVQVVVVGPPGGMKPGDQYLNPTDSSKWGWYIPSGSRRWSPGGSDNNDAYHLEGFNRGGLYNGAIGNAYDHWFSGGVPYERLATVLLKFASTDSTWDPKAAPRDSNFSRGYRYVRHATDTSTFASHPGWSALITNRSNGYAYQDYDYGVPFSAWNVDVNPPVRLAVGHLENNAAGGMVDGKWWPPSTADPAPDNAVTQREYWFIFDAPYTDPAPNPALTVDIQRTLTPMMWMGMPDMVSSSYSAGDEFIMLPYHPNGPGNVFTYSTKAPTTGDIAIARADVTRINVFPNPYRSFDPASPFQITNVVTFSHLPQKAVIRVFTLSGVLVKTMLKDDPGQFVTWNLLNEAGHQVASGIYIVYIDMPDLGSTKTLKLGILAETH